MRAMQDLTPTPAPALAEVRGRRLTNRELGRRLGFSEDWVGRMLLGHAPPSRRFRRRLADLLQLEEERLFPTEPRDA